MLGIVLLALVLTPQPVNVDSRRSRGAPIGSENSPRWLGHGRPVIHDTVESINLAELLRTELAGDVIGRIASGIGAPVANVRMAADRLGVVMVAVLAKRATTSQALDDLIDLMHASGFDGRRSQPFLGRPPVAASLIDLVARGLPVAARLLGSRKTTVIDWIASMAALDSQRASALLALIAPLALHVVGRQARLSGGLSRPVLADLLRSQIAVLQGTAPDGMAAAFGWIDLSGAVVTGALATDTSPTGSRRWLRWTALRSPWRRFS